MLTISQEVTSVLRRIALSTSRTTRLTQLSGAFHTNVQVNCEQKKSEEEESNSVSSEEPPPPPKTQKELERDRTRIIPVETAIKYMKSAAFKQTYGEHLVWEQYRRNHKGPIPPRKTRKTCIRKGVISTGNPCPICRDEYLVLDHRNTELLKQFISPYTGQVLSYTKTGVCQKRHLELLVAVERAKDIGLITYDIPFREYDYSEYYGKQFASEKNTKA